jgi:hypothetical protein
MEIESVSQHVVEPTPGCLGGRVRAYRIPYFALSGKRIPFARYRLLDPYTPKGSKKPAKYLQDRGTGSHFYFPPFIEWTRIAKDPTTPLYITEGEKKAAAVCKIGSPCIGLGGVWNFVGREDADGPSEAIADFGAVEWKGRVVNILFDSDAAYKSGVRAALGALRSELIRRGANPFEISLPQINGSDKTGIDDFLLHHNRDKKAALAALPRRALFMPEGITADTLLATDIPAPRFVVEGLVPHGLTVLAGPPKIGKSWLALALGLSVATGAKVFGKYNSTAAEALYLALEDNPARLKSRLQRLKAQGAGQLHLFTEWPRVEEDGLLALDRWLAEHPHCRLAIIDTLARMRPTRSERSDLYFHDYDATAALKRIADTRNVALVLVHHLRKAGATDPFDRISGSTGITGAADTNIVLTRARTSADAELAITGRDITEQSLALRFDAGVWSALGEAGAYRMSQERQQIADAIRTLGGAATPSDVARHVGKDRRTVNKLMTTMGNVGELRWTQGGKYVLGD